MLKKGINWITSEWKKMLQDIEKINPMEEPVKIRKYQEKKDNEQNKDISLSSFIDLYLMDLFHTLRNMIVEVWSDYRQDDAPELEKNDEDLNYALVALFDPIFHISFGAFQYAYGKTIFKLKIMELGKEEGWCDARDITAFNKKVHIWEDPMSEACTEEDEDPAAIIIPALAKKKGCRDGFGAVIYMSTGKTFFDTAKFIQKTTKKYTFGHEHPEDLDYLRGK